MLIGSVSTVDVRAEGADDTDLRPTPAGGIGLRANAALAVWLTIVVASPLAILVNWAIAYGFYAVLVVVSALMFDLQDGQRRARYPAIVVVQLLALFALAIAHADSIPTIVNIGSIAVGFATIGLMLVFLPRNDLMLQRMFVWWRSAGLILVLIGIAAGPALASLMALDNPIQDALSGGRVRIFSRQFGHSPLIDVGIVTLLIAASNVGREGVTKRLMLAGIGLIFAYFARSSIGYIGILACLYAWIVEIVPLRARVRNVIHGITIGTIFAVAPFASDDILLQLRTLQVGDSFSQTYKSGDLTAGRAELNKLLLAEVKTKPLIGIGTEDELLVYGVADEHGRSRAASESGLRIAAKFGWPYFFLVLAIIISPLMTLLTQSRPARILGIGLALYCANVFAFNGFLELSHTWSTIAFLPLVLFLGSFGYANRVRRI